MNTKILCFIVIFVSLTKADDHGESLVEIDDLVDTLEPFTSNCEPKPKKELIKEMLRRSNDGKREIKCLRYCLMKQFGWMNESETEVVIDKSVEFYNTATHMNEKELKELAKMCVERVKNVTDKCELAHLYEWCLVENIEKRGFIALPFKE